jgi:hypothetical protein
MINFRLLFNDFKDSNVDYEILTINKKTFDTTSTFVEKSISNFNEEISWNQMFDLNEALHRINNDMEMYIGVIDNEPFGHVWFKDYRDGRLLFNLFVKNNVKDRKYSGTTFTSNILKKYELIKSPIYCEINDWNEKSIKLFKKLGFEVI